MITFHKFPLSGSVSMPGGAKVTKVGADAGGMICVWALVNTANPFETRNFKMFPTGVDITWDREGYEFLDTVFDGPFVWHVYMEKQAFELEY